MESDSRANGRSMENRGAVKVGIVRLKISAFARSLFGEKPAEWLPPRAFDNLTALCLLGGKSVGLEHHLDASDDFVELVLAKFRIRFPEIRPSMNVVDHYLEIVAVDVVVQAAGNGVNAVVTLLPRV